MLRLALRPRWVLMLLLALGVAAGFAALGQWQISRAVDHDSAPSGASETLVPLHDVLMPDSVLRTQDVGQRVSVTGSFKASDNVIISDRLNGDVLGFWIVGRFDALEAGDPALAVARGWVETFDEAEAAVSGLARDDAAVQSEPITINGRLLPNEAPVRPATGASTNELTTVALAALVNRWSDLGERPVYRGYVVSSEAASGLVLIDAPPPDSPITVNWLNVFYAVEWVVFAGFAVFLWYRLLRDEFEREQEEAAEAAEGAANESMSASVAVDQPN